MGFIQLKQLEEAVRKNEADEELKRKARDQLRALKKRESSMEQQEKNLRPVIGEKELNEMKKLQQ